MAEAMAAVEKADAAALRGVQEQEHLQARRGTVLQRMDEVRRLLGELACEELPKDELAQIGVAEVAMDIAFESAAIRSVNAGSPTVFAQGSARAPIDYLDV